MNVEPEDYELIARAMDGEQADLTDARRALAEDITRQADRIGPAMDVAPPAGTLHRVNALVRQAVSVSAPVPATAWRRFGRIAAIAAAVVVVSAVAAIMIGLKDPVTVDKIASRPDAAIVGEYVHPDDEELDLRVEMLAEDIAELQGRIVMDEDWRTELALAGVEDGIEEFLLDEDNWDSLTAPEGWDESF